MYDKKMRAAIEFFHANAGGVVGQAMLGAVELAKAEAYAEAHGWEFEWIDSDTDPFDCDESLHDELRRKLENGAWVNAACILHTHIKRHAASLWGIIGPDWSPYWRVVQAELAFEALYAIRQGERFAAFLTAEMRAA